jgi:hypothetical protein
MRTVAHGGTTETELRASACTFTVRAMSERGSATGGISYLPLGVAECYRYDEVSPDGWLP